MLPLAVQTKGRKGPWTSVSYLCLFLAVKSTKASNSLKFCLTALPSLTAAHSNPPITTFSIFVTQRRDPHGAWHESYPAAAAESEWRPERQALVSSRIPREYYIFIGSLSRPLSLAAACLFRQPCCCYVFRAPGPV